MLVLRHAVLCVGFGYRSGHPSTCSGPFFTLVPGHRTPTPPPPPHHIYSQSYPPPTIYPASRVIAQAPARGQESTNIRPNHPRHSRVCQK